MFRLRESRNIIGSYRFLSDHLTLLWLQEALCETNDELQETSREEARELREEIEQGHVQILNLTRHVDACRETISDYEKTLSKFRDLVTELQAQNNELRCSLAEGQREKETKLQSELVGIQQAFPHPDSMVQPSALGLSLVSQAQTLGKVSLPIY